MVIRFFMKSGTNGYKYTTGNKKLTTDGCTRAKREKNFSFLDEELINEMNRLRNIPITVKEKGVSHKS